jgi:hypothetical protein
MWFRSRSQAQFAILPPSRLETPFVFRNIEASNRRHNDLMAKMQRLRGRVYGADGAIRPSQLTADGRHKLSIDERSWHVLSLDANGDVIACLRYLEESQASGFESLRIRSAAVARCPVQGPRFRRAVEREMNRANSNSIGFGEVGGWAVSEDHRRTSESLRIVLATYGLLELLGSCAGVATATFRHSSATILQRIGLTTLRYDGDEIPPYHDPQYGCLMQILYFDSRSPNPKYSAWIQDLIGDLASAPIVCRENRTAALEQVWRGLKAPEFIPHGELISIGV